ncbi:Methyltransferase-like protein 23, partial [Mortierella sp. AD011]
MESQPQRACRQFSYKSGQLDIPVKVLELLDPDFGLYVWPSALVLAEYIAHRLDMFNGSPDNPKVILELGAGTALPSLLLAKATRDNFLIVTDRPDVPQILANVQEALKENGIQTLYPQDPNARVLVRGLGWGDFTFANEYDKVGGLQQLLKDISCMEQINNLSSSSSRSRGQIDLILGSDVFYNPP